MDLQDEEFLARLLATFGEEAADHVQAIIAGILVIEQDPSRSQQSEIEPVYRATHSLKGAARAVGLKDIETICQHLESVFSSVRKGEMILTQSEFDLIHDVITTLELLLAGDKTVKITPIIQKLKTAVHSSQTSPVREVPPAPPQKASIREPATPPDASHSEPVTPELLSVSSPGKGTAGPKIRISEERLTSLYETADDLLSYRMSAGSHLSELKSISRSVQTWRWSLSRVEGDIANLKRQFQGTNDFLDRLLHFIDTTRDIIGSCETKLDSTIRAMTQDHSEMDSAITQLIESIREVVLVPFSSLTDAYPRMVRDIAREQGKKVSLRITGSDIEIDRRILDGIRDPMIHLIRNAVDHGIEPEEIRLRFGKPAEGNLSIEIVHNRANQISITISDDGKGIDPQTAVSVAISKGLLDEEEAQALTDREKERLIFQSGFTTSSHVSTVSGRGLGLAIVQEKINQVGGIVDVESIPGKSTRFFLTVPITLATFRGILVYAENRPFFLPLTDVERVMIPDASEITTIEGRTVLYLENQAIPVVLLSSVLGLSSGSPQSEDARSVVLLRTPNRRFGLIVNQIGGAQEIVVRDLGPQLKDIRFVSGVAILSNTLIVPVLQVEDIAEEMQGKTRIGISERELPSSLSGRRKIMVVEDSITSRMLLKNILEGAGYDVETAVDGLDAFTRLKTLPVDIVVSDVDMPRMNGFALTEKIRSEKKLSDLPVILVTSLDSREDREHGITVGANAYIIKSSFDQGNLLEVITRLIGAGR
jgi:two-component system chemotaxis sensor kinase CheA